MPGGSRSARTGFERAERLKKLPPYLFVEIDRRKREAEARGMDLVNLGIGDPDLPSPPAVVEALRGEAGRPENHRYPSAAKVREFNEAVAAWFRARFGVSLDPSREVLPLIGTKEGLGHFPLAFVNPGETVLVPDPGYPVYRASTILAGGRPVSLPLDPAGGFLPDFERMGARLRRARMMFLNYPNNPTGAVADLDFYGRAAGFAAKNDTVLVNDAAYSEITFGGYRSPSLLEVKAARRRAVEFHSFSKTYNMCGWRVGFAVGAPDLIAGLAALKSNLDSHVFGAVLGAAVAALGGGPEYLRGLLSTYRERQEILLRGLRDLGASLEAPRGTFYLWVPVPGDGDSMRFAARMIRRAGVVAAPGVGFGPRGEGYVRLSLTSPTERVREAVRRLSDSGFRFDGAGRVGTRAPRKG